MNVIQTELPGVIIFEPDVFGDERGYFVETWSRQRYEEAGIEENFCQDNVSFSQNRILRGLHYQYPHPQGKLVSVVSGEVFDVAVDIRVGSPTFGRHVDVYLSEDNHRQLYIPPGFAHGFCVVSDTARFSYKCTAYYDHASEGSIIWNDPDIGVNWPIDNPLLSKKDSQCPGLKDIAPDKMPRFEENS